MMILMCLIVGFNVDSRSSQSYCTYFLRNRYLILKLLTDSYLATFVVTVLLMSFDFWTTKNLTARKLVGLRWWSEIS
jgi:hypothetical protein